MESQICIPTESGGTIESRIRSQRERFAAVIGVRPPAKVLIEASTESEWVARCLEQLGLEVIVADPNCARTCRAPDGRVRWTRAVFQGAFSDLAVWNESIVGDSVVRSADGSVVGSLNLGQNAISDFALLGLAARYLVYTDFAFAPGQARLAPINLEPPASGAASPLWPDVPYTQGPLRPSPVLLTEGRVLAPAGMPGSGCQADYAVRVLGPNGDLSSCRLPGVTGPDAFMVVQPQRLVGLFSNSCDGQLRGGLVAFDAPALAPGRTRMGRPEAKSSGPS